MENVRTVAKNALKKVCKVMDEDQAATNREKEYATVYIVSGVYTEYANGKPTQRRDNVDINIYAVDIKRLDELIAKVEPAMRAAGFIPQDLPQDLGEDQNQQMFGAAQEFAIFRMVPGGV